MSQPLAEQPLERQIMITRHQLIPAPPFLRVPHRTNPHLSQPYPLTLALSPPHPRIYTTATFAWPVPNQPPRP